MPKTMNKVGLVTDCIKELDLVSVTLLIEKFNQDLVISVTILL